MTNSDGARAEDGTVVDHAGRGCVVVLNGGSSSGKTSLARALQELLWPTPWITLGVDSLIDALPPSFLGADGGLELASDGAVNVGATFRSVERAWLCGLSAMVAAGANLIVDEVFLGGAKSQERLRTAFSDLEVRWIGVTCTPKAAMERERQRGDRVAGQAAIQADLVHIGVEYDLIVDTTTQTARECATAVASLIAPPQ